MNKPDVDTPAPDFTATAVGGQYTAPQSVTLSGLRGRPVILYFYPKDDTPGCTVQACDVRDHWAELAQRAHLFGVSIDSVKSHEKFIRKHGLTFPLLSDEDQSIVDAYGVWVEKKMYGKTFMGVERSTFVIGPDGDVVAVLEKVKPADHVAQLRQTLEQNGW